MLKSYTGEEPYIGCSLGRQDHSLGQCMAGTGNGTGQNMPGQMKGWITSRAKVYTIRTLLHESQMKDEGYNPEENPTQIARQG